MAFGAIEPEPAFVHILVAGIALIGQYADTVLKDGERGGILQLVAFLAINLPVFSFQGEQRFCVVKLAQASQIGKRVFVVAFLAIGPQVVVVLVFVATAAIFKGYA